MIFGFFTVRFRQKIPNKTIRAYCWTMNVFCFSIWCGSLLFKIIKAKKFDFTVIIYLIMDAVRTATVTYYKTKHLKHPNEFSDILENIRFVEEHLQNAGIKVQYTRNRIICTLYIVTLVLLHLAITYLITLDTANRLKTFNTVQEHFSLCNEVVKYVMFYSGVLFVMHFVCIAYVIGDRMRLVRLAVEKCMETRLRKSTWGGGTDFFGVGGIRRLIMRHDNYLKHINLLRNSMCDVFNTANDWYKHFFYSSLICSVIGSSILLILTTKINGVNLFVVCSNFAQFSIIPLCVSVFVGNQCQKLDSILYSFCHTNNCKALSRNVKAMYYSRIHADKIFDCGYFEVDWKLLSVVFNFVPLFVFADLSPVKL